MNLITESARKSASPTLSEAQGDKVVRMMPVAFTPSVVALCPYAAAWPGRGAAVVGAYEAGRAAG